MPAHSTLEDELVAVFALDPGRTSGVMEFIGVLGSNVRETFDLDEGEHLEIYQVDCQDEMVEAQFAEKKGAEELVERYIAFEYKATVEYGVEKANIVLACEDFVLRSGKDHNSDRSGLAPVRVTNLMMGIMHARTINWAFQSPSDAMSAFPNQRLKDFGLWARGKEHGRDAARHGALWVRRALT